MLDLLDGIQDVVSSNPALAERLSATAFVPTDNGLAAPSSLYDPRNEEMVALLDPSTHFPAEPLEKDDEVHVITAFSCLHPLLRPACMHA